MKDKIKLANEQEQDKNLGSPLVSCGRWGFQPKNDSDCPLFGGFECPATCWLFDDSVYTNR